MKHMSKNHGDSNNLSENSSKSENSGSENLGNILSDKLLKVKEVANLIGETDHVLRNWLKDLESFIPIQKSESGYKLFDESAVKTVRHIQHLIRVQGYSIKQVEYHFATGGQEFIPTIPAPVKTELDEIKKMLEQQKEFNQALIERLDRQQEYIEKSIKTRDEELMSTIRALQEAKHKRKWYQFWGGKNT